MTSSSQNDGGSIGRVERRAVRLAPGGEVAFEPLFATSDMPIMARVKSGDLDAAAWARDHRSEVDRALRENGGILFRGFRNTGLVGFRALVDALASDLLEYTYRSTPRTQVSDRIYTSTEYPANLEIPLHNENSYSRTWPRKIFFFCELRAEEGGETPIAASRRVFERISPSVRERFASRGVRYVRNYGVGADLSWQEVFQSGEPRAVEDFCRGADIQFEWKSDGGLRTWQVAQGTARRAGGGEEIWFNQAHLFHVSSLGGKVAAEMLEVFGEIDLPRNAFFGDGQPLDGAELEEIREAYRAEARSFPWQEGDILLLDNMAMAHGRMPYSGARRIRVAMSDPYHAEDAPVSA